MVNLKFNCYYEIRNKYGSRPIIGRYLGMRWKKGSPSDKFLLFKNPLDSGVLHIYEADIRDADLSFTECNQNTIEVLYGESKRNTGRKNNV